MATAQPSSDAPVPDRAPPPFRLRLLPTPDGDAGAGSRSPIVGQESLDLQFMLPGGLPAVPEVCEALLAPAPRKWGDDAVEAHGSPTGRAVLPPVGPWAARLAQAVLEVCTAGRPVGQLLRWTDPAIYEDLERRYCPRAHRAVARRRVPIAERVRSIHVCEPADGVAEASVVIAGGERPRALALRLEGRRGRWVCTALDWI
jgi:hypothetical protein